MSYYFKTKLVVIHLTGPLLFFKNGLKVGESARWFTHNLSQINRWNSSLKTNCWVRDEVDKKFFYLSIIYQNMIYIFHLEIHSCNHFLLFNYFLYFLQFTFPENGEKLNVFEIISCMSSVAIIILKPIT